MIGVPLDIAYGKEYRFYLSYNTVETEINGIDGWDNIGKEFERSKTYHTPFRSISAKLRFLITDGGSIIKDAYYNDGIDSVINFRVKKHNHITDDYDTYYTAIVDLKPENVEITNDFVECNLIDSSKENRFVVNDSVNFNVFSRTAIDGATVPELETEVQTIDLKVPDIYLETIGTILIGNGDTANIEINGELASNIKDHKVPIEGVWTEIYNSNATYLEADSNKQTESTAEITGLSTIFSEQIAEEQLEVFIKMVYDTLITRFNGSNVEYTPAQVDNIVADWWFNSQLWGPGYVVVTEEMNLFIDGVKHTICTRENTVTQASSGGGYSMTPISITPSRMNGILELAADGFTGLKKVELIPSISLRYRGMQSVSIVSYPLYYFKMYDKVLDPQSTYIKLPIFTKDENTDLNKIGTSQKLFFKNEVFDQVNFSVFIGQWINFLYTTSQATFPSTSPYFYYDDINADPNYTTTLTFKFTKYNASNELLSTDILYTKTWERTTIGAEYVLALPLNKTIDLSLLLNEYYNFEMEFVINGNEGINNAASVSFYDTQRKNINILTQVINNATISVRGLYLYDAMFRLIQLATGETNAAKVLDSDILTTGAMKDIFVTSGYLLRNFDTGLNLSIYDLFRTIDTLGCLSLGYDRTSEKYVIEGRMAGYKNEAYSKIGEVKELKIKLNEDEFVNQIVLGHEKVRYDYLTGANEYNTKTEYAVNIPVKNELILEQPYRTDTIGIVLQLLNQYSDSTGLDLNGDDDIFLIKTVDSEAKQNGTDWTGFLGIDTYLNGEFIARDVLKKHILSPQFKRVGNASDIRFIKSDYTKVVYEDAASKFSDIAKTELPETDKIPEKYILQAALSNAVIEEINSDPNKFLDLKYLGNPFQGWIKSIKRSDYKGIANVELYAREYSQIEDTGFEYTLPFNLE